MTRPCRSCGEAGERYRVRRPRERSVWVYLCADDADAERRAGARVTAEPWTTPPPRGEAAFEPRQGDERRVREALALRRRREALGLTVEHMAAMTRRTVGAYVHAEAGRSHRMHWSDRFVIASALGIEEERARADLDSWTRDHPDADREALLVVHPTPVLGPRDIGGWGVAVPRRSTRIASPSRMERR